MALELEREVYSAKAGRYSKPVEVSEMIGGLTAGGRGNLLGDRIVVAHPEPPKPVDEALNAKKQVHKDGSDETLFMVIGVGLIGLFLISRYF
jgi:hypothetical protein